MANGDFKFGRNGGHVAASSLDAELAKALEKHERYLVNPIGRSGVDWMANQIEPIKRKPHDEEHMLDMIAMRLRCDGADDLPFDFITAHQINSDRAVVFIVHDGQPQHIEDDGNLFPSDALITKLRLLME